MIVKNESTVIKRCLDSIKWVDGIFIVDTGSTDQTPHMIKTWQDENDKKGSIQYQEWKNFGHNRTEALKSAQKWLSKNNYDLDKVYLLFMDADMCFQQGDKLKPILNESDVWFIPQENKSMRYLNLRFAKASLDIVVKCPTHEYYEIKTKNYKQRNYEEISIDDLGDGGCKQNKAERDISLLKDGLVEEPDNLRYWFYLANTFKDTKQYEKAIKAYEQRVKKTGWYEELYCSYLYKGDCHLSLDEKEKAVFSWLNAFNTDPCRLESLCRLAGFYRKESKHHTAMLFIDLCFENLTKDTKRMLFLEKPAYTYMPDYELSICAYYVGQKEKGKQAILRLLEQEDIPIALKNSIQNNKKFYIEE